MTTKSLTKVTASIIASAMLSVSPIVLTPAHAANSLMELFGRRSTAPVSVPAQVAPTVPKSPMTPKVKAADMKRVTVSAPKVYDYKPEKLVLIDFSQIDFQATNSTRSSTAETRLPLLPPYNVVLEGTGSDETPVNAPSQSHGFSKVNVKAEKPIADAIVKFYSLHRGYVWSQNGSLNDKAKQLLRFFNRADEDGLQPNDYMVQEPDVSLTGEARNDALLAFDVALSARALRYVTDAAEGRIIADRLSAFHDLPRKNLDLDMIMQQINGTDQPQTMLSGYLPQSNAYLALKLELANLPHSDTSHTVQLARNTVIKPGQNDSALPQFISLLLQRAPRSYLDSHRDVLEKHQTDTSYDLELRDAIVAYQKLVGNNGDGVIGPATISALMNDNAAVKREKIIASLERLRWLPHDFGNRYVFINQASYRAQYFDDHQMKLDMKVVVGSPRNQTYFFYDNIRLVTFNPSWGVPRSIVLNEMLPRIVSDNGYLSRNNYELYDSAGKRVSAGAVNWQRVASTGNGVSIRQMPGKNNALGELKILFPNKHDIYLHDTPNKTAFTRDMRAVSHGCVRLEHPREMAAAVLGKSVSDLQPYFGKNERSVSLKEQVPVYLTYFTAWPDIKDGQIKFYDDVYDRDELLIKAMEKTDMSRSQES